MSENTGRVIRPPNQLNSKVTIGGPGAVDAAALERAEKVIASLAGDYVDWAKDDVKKIEAVFQLLKTGKGDAGENLNDVFQIAHDIKGQGGSFDFPLMTVIASHLCRFIENLDGKTNKVSIEIIGLHINSLNLVISRGLKGDGGLAGDQLLSGIEKVLEKRA
ncbi:MAG: Hpt domain-containing protein [Rhodospirillales bacterium]|nr:Hpt domain-containing protein [Rhodospirillales bacterium]